MPKAVLIIQKIASSLPKADHAAVVSVPKVLIADWMAIFVIANRMDSNPVGSPSFSCMERSGPWKRIFLRERQRIPLERVSFNVTRTALTACASSVAMATPVTPMWKRSTKAISRIMLTIQQMIRI